MTDQYTPPQPLSIDEKWMKNELIRQARLKASNDFRKPIRSDEFAVNRNVK